MTHFASYGHTLNVQDAGLDSVSVKLPYLREGEATHKWPFLLWFYLKTLGLYHSGTYIAARSVIYTAVRGAGLKIKEGVFKLYPKT